MKTDDDLNFKKDVLKRYIPLNISIRIAEHELKLMLNDHNLKNFIETSVDKEFCDTITSILVLLKNKTELYVSILWAIESMENDTEKNLLHLKYILGYSWEKISEIMNYSLRQIYNLHLKALRDFPCPISNKTDSK